MKVERNGKEFELTKDELFLAHKEYVTSSMQHVLENDFEIPAKYSALIAKEAFHMYHEGGHEEHLSIELAAGNYHTLTHEPTVKILSTESTEFDTGREMPLHEANSRFKDVDQLTHELYGDRSYDKTKFQLNFSLNGEQVVYEGVQNLGNLEGSLIDHIRNDENMQVYNRYYYDLNAVHDPTKADRIRNNGSFLLVPYLESHISLSNKETIIQEQLHNSDVLTIEANADYLHAMENYIQESRYCLNVGYDLPAEPRKVDFDQNLADSKSKNLEVTSQESEKKKPHNSPSKSHKTKSIRL